MDNPYYDPLDEPNEEGLHMSMKNFLVLIGVSLGLWAILGWAAYQVYLRWL